MKQVFISYSRRDKKRADELCVLLESNGITCWMDQESIPLGEDFVEEIARAIDECKVMIALISAKSQESKYVVREIKYAIEREKTIIPIKVERVKLNRKVEFLISEYHQIDAYEDWGKAKERILKRICSLTGMELSEKKAKNLNNHVINPLVQNKELMCPCCGSNSTTKVLVPWFGNKKTVDRIAEIASAVLFICRLLLFLIAEFYILDKTEFGIFTVRWNLPDIVGQILLFVVLGIALVVIGMTDKIDAKVETVTKRILQRTKYQCVTCKKIIERKQKL